MAHFKTPQPENMGSTVRNIHAFQVGVVVMCCCICCCVDDLSRGEPYNFDPYLPHVNLCVNCRFFSQFSCVVQVLDSAKPCWTLSPLFTTEILQTIFYFRYESLCFILFFLWSVVEGKLREKKGKIVEITAIKSLFLTYSRIRISNQCFRSVSFLYGSWSCSGSDLK